MRALQEVENSTTCTLARAYSCIIHNCGQLYTASTSLAGLTALVVGVVQDAGLCLHAVATVLRVGMEVASSRHAPDTPSGTGGTQLHVVSASLNIICRGSLTNTLSTPLLSPKCRPSSHLHVCREVLEAFRQEAASQRAIGQQGDASCLTEA